MIYFIFLATIASAVVVPSFGMSSYLVFEDILPSAGTSVISIEFKTSSEDGILFWNSDGSDFVGVGLSGGRVVFTFDLGSGENHYYHGQVYKPDLFI